MESTMAKTRKRHGFLNIPEDFEEFIDLINQHSDRFNNIYGEPFLSGLVGQGNECAIVFTVRQLLNILQQEEIHLDGTFKCVPRKPKAYQLCTIIAMHRDHAFPVAFCLMTKKTARLYKLVIRHLKTLQPMSPTRVISDYEAGIKCAVAAEFPLAKHVGCWFHFTQSIFKKVIKLGLRTQFRNNAAVNKGVHMLMAIALLPQDKVEEGFFITETFFEIQAKPELVQGDRTKIDSLLRYFKTQWMERVGSKSFSVFGQKHRTNNIQESFHRQLNSIVGTAHPNIWSFLGALIRIGKDCANNFIRVQNGDAINRNRKTKWLLQDKRILEAQKKVTADPQELTVFQFLSTLAYRVKANPSTSEPQEEDEEEILVGLDEDAITEEVPVDEEEDEEVDGEQNLAQAVEQQKAELATLQLDLHDEEVDANSLSCLACGRHKRAYSIDPCGHLAMCGSCTDIHRAGRENAPHLRVTCPVCRAVVSSYRKIYY